MAGISQAWRRAGCLVALILITLAPHGQEDPGFRRPPYRIPPEAPPAGGTQLVFAQLGATNTTANGSSYTTLESYTPTANALVIAIVMTSDTVIPVTPTFSGNGLTWITIGTTNSNDLTTQLNKITAFRAMGASPTASVGTAAFSAAVTGCLIYVCEFRNADVTCGGSDALVQVAFNGANASANPVVTLAALGGGGDNAVLGASGHDVNPPGGTAEGSWTEDRDAGYNTPATGLYVMHRTNTTDNTWGPTIGASDWAAIAFEVMPDNGMTHNCPPSSPLIAETLEGAGYSDTGWTETLGGGTINEDYTTSPIAGSDSLRVVKGSGDQTYISQAFTSIGEAWAYYRIRINTMPSAEEEAIVIFQDNVGGTMASVELQTDGTLQINCGTANAITTDAMSTATDYHLWFHYLKGTGANGVADVGFSTDGTRPTSGNKFKQVTTGTTTANVETFIMGFVLHFGAHTPEAIFDTIYVDDEQIGDQ